jgi:RNA polymerase sigma-70 factor (ECF subfamily)
VTDAELVERLRKGDPAAFRDLVRLYADRLFGLAYSLVGSSADAEDVVQETLLAALKRIESFEGRTSLATWLRSIVVFQASKARRSRKVRSAVPIHEQERLGFAGDDRLSTRSPAAAVDSRSDVAQMLQTLSPEHREVLVLRELQQLSYEEISQTLAIPVGTVMSRLHRARQELRQRFSGYEP